MACVSVSCVSECVCERESISVQYESMCLCVCVCKSVHRCVLMGTHWKQKRGPLDGAALPGSSVSRLLPIPGRVG